MAILSKFCINLEKYSTYHSTIHKQAKKNREVRSRLGEKFFYLQKFPKEFNLQVKMYYDNEEFEQKIDGYKIPRGGKRQMESDGPFVGPPKSEKDKYAEWKRDGSKQRSPNKGYHTHDKGSRNNSRKSNNDYMTGGNTAPLGQNSRSNAP